MKKFLAVLCILFAGVFGTARAFACNSGEIDVEGTCVSGKFAVKTTNLNANDTVNFTMTAVGTFSVNCGDGGTLSGSGVSGNTITRSGTSKTTYTCTYSTGGSKIIAFDGTATSYSTAYVSNNSYTNDNYAVLGFFGNTKIAKFFGDLSELLPQYGTSMAEYPRFINAFRNCTNLVSIPAELFSNYTGGASMFVGTFLNIGITSIPSGLFDGITNAPTRIFSHTFYGCTALTSIPSDLFRNVTSAADYAFNQTFANCTGLTSIPDDLFGGITTSAPYMFNLTFYNDANITGYIPSSTFAGLIDANSPTTTGMWTNTFANTQLSSTCPANMDEVQTTYKGTTAGTQWGNYAMCDAPSGPRITYEMNGGTNYVGAPTHYVEGTGVTIDGMPTKSGYTFAGWCDDSELTTNCALTKTITALDTGDKTYYAKWTACTACAATNASCELSVVNNTCTYTTACESGYENIQNNGAYNASCTLIPPTYNITYDLGGTCAVAVAPSGYTQLEYIQTTGTQYVDTGISPDMSTKWVLDTEFVTVGTNGVVQLGNNGDSSAGGYFRFDIGARSGGGLNLNLGPVVTVNANGDFLNQRMTYMIDAPNMTWAYGNTSGSYTVNPGTPSPSGRRTIVIGARHIASSGIDVNPPQVKIYSSQIYTDGTLVQNLIPVRRNSDNVLGMYDVVSDTFKTFSGSSLLAGDPINPSVCENYNNAPATYTYGVGATVNGIPTRPYYTFAGWCTDSELTNCAMSQTIGTDATGDKTFYAKWTSNSSYTVTYSCGTGATGNPPSSETVMDGASFTPAGNNTCAKTGYTFNGWNDGTTDRLVGTAYTYNYDDDVTLTATWAANTYNITLNNISEIPAGYTLLDYIESTGAQYILTDYIGSLNSRYEGAVYVPSNSDRYYIASRMDTGNTRNIVLAGGYSNFYIGYGVYTTENYRMPIVLNKRVDFVTDYKEMSKSLTVDGITSTQAINSSEILSGFANTAPLQIFFNRLNGAGSAVSYAAQSGTKIYYLKIYDNNVLVHDFIPARRNSDDVLGMYDTVTGTFFTNDGTGTFTAGPAALGSTTQTYTYGVGTILDSSDAGTRNGYIFAGWCTDSELTNCAMSQTIGTDATGDKTFYAKWTSNSSYTVTYSCGTGATGNPPSSETVVSGTSFTPSDNDTCAKTGYTFNGWNDGTTDRPVGTAYTYSYNDDITLTATWAANTYNITLSNGELSIDLPSGYTQLEYIQTNGSNSYIDTGHAPTMATKWELDSEFITCGMNGVVEHGSGGDSSAGGYWRFDITASCNGNFGLYLGPAVTVNANDNFLNQRMTCVIDAPNMQWSYGNTTGNYTLTPGNPTDSWTILIGARHTGANGVEQYNNIKVYSSKLYSNGTLIQHLVPAKRNSDGVVGMYDIVNNIFRTKSGSGNLTEGPTASSFMTYTYGVGTILDSSDAGTRNGYTFAGWCTDSELTNCAMTQTIGTTATGDKTFYAKWIQGCSLGYYYTNNICTICPINNYCADGYSAVACAAGLYSPVGATEAAQCGRILHVGNDVLYLRASKITPHALHVDVDHDGVADYFGNMTTADVAMHAGSERKLKVKMGDTVYSIYDDTVTLPTE